jgi:hypothetical protein
MTCGPPIYVELGISGDDFLDFVTKPATNATVSPRSWHGPAGCPT